MLASWLRHPIHKVKTTRARTKARQRLFPQEQPAPRENVSPDARKAAELILEAHRAYLSEFNVFSGMAQDTFENRTWTQGVLNADRRVRLYRAAVDETWQRLKSQFPEQLPDREFWMGARRAFLEQVFDDYDSDLALTFFYSTMRIAFDGKDAPVEYADDGLAERSHIWSPEPAQTPNPKPQTPNPKPQESGKS